MMTLKEQSQLDELREAIVQRALALVQARNNAAWTDKSEVKELGKALDTAKMAIGQLHLAVEDYSNFIIHMSKKEDIGCK